MPKTRLLLLDDHALFREGLSRLLATEPDLEVVGQFSTTDEALACLAAEPVDMVLLDFDLGEERGFEFIRRARDGGYNTRIFIVTAGMGDADSLRALGHGVCGIFLKTSPPGRLNEAIGRIMRGETWIDPQCMRALARAVERTSERTPPRQVTDRERDVLNGVLEGLSNKEIAGKLGISEGSVKSALQQLFLKTGVRTRSQLVRVAVEEYATLWRLQR